jgi:2-oxoglutarate dehydrogenase E1 component
VFTPKQLLRHPKAISSLADLADGHFQALIDDTIDEKAIDTLVFCSGKLYYELLDQREKTTKYNIALIRLEQLYPLAQVEIQAVLNKYKEAKKIIWAQEEPENMGAWTYVLVNLRKMIPNIEVVSRPASASPAPGSYQLDALLQKGVRDAIFG